LTQYVDQVTQTEPVVTGDVVTPEPTREDMVREYLEQADHDTLAKLSPAYNKTLQRSIDKAVKAGKREALEAADSRVRQSEELSRAETYYENLDSDTFRKLMRDPQHAENYRKIQQNKGTTQDVRTARLDWAEEVVNGLMSNLEGDPDYEGLPVEEILQEGDISSFLKKISDHRAGRTIELERKELEKTIDKVVEARVTQELNKRNLGLSSPSQPEGGRVPSNTERKFTPEEIDKMSTTEYERNRDAILKQYPY
jgi:hypothetical protein